MAEGFMEGAKRLVGRVPFLQDAVALYYCMLDNKTPIWAKGAIASALTYLLLPVDVVPDVTPLLGFTDDAGAIFTVIKQVGNYLTDYHYWQASEFFGYHQEVLEEEVYYEEGYRDG